jgi:hypothetical protein
MQTRDEWLSEFEAASADFRSERAAKFRANRMRARRERATYDRELTRRAQALPSRGGPLEALTDKEVEADMLRAERRAERCERLERGQLRRVDAVRDCGSKALRQLCNGCGTPVVPDKAVECGHVRICLSCRGSVAHRRRKDFRHSRDAFLRSEAAWSLRRRSAPGGHWSDKFITLTVPHSGDPARDARELAAAWKRFRRALCLWLEHELRVPKPLLRFPYVRVQEITPSDGGHAHYHLWAFLPYVPQPVFAVLWAGALSQPYRAKLRRVAVEKLLSAQTDPRSRTLIERTLVTRRGACGRSLDEVPMPIVDLRAGRNAEHELIKYLVKDA